MESDLLPRKLDLIRKALNYSRGRLAAELGVDKSVVSRWLSGTTRPSANNLGALTALVAKQFQGFSLLDWERDLQDLAGLLRLDEPEAFSALIGEPHPKKTSSHLPFAAVETARRQTERRGASYEGLWQITQPAFTKPGRLVHTHALIRVQDGLLQMRWGAPGWLCTGPLLIVMGQLFGMLVDEADDTVLFCVLNGVSMPRVEILDGLMLTNAKDGPQTPTAAPCYLERVADLKGDELEDENRYETMRQSPEVLSAENVPEALRRHLLPDIGPAAASAGGEMLLRTSFWHSLSRGGPVPDW